MVFISGKTETVFIDIIEKTRPELIIYSINPIRHRNLTLTLRKLDWNAAKEILRIPKGSELYEVIRAIFGVKVHE